MADALAQLCPLCGVTLAQHSLDGLAEEVLDALGEPVPDNVVPLGVEA